MKCVQYCPSATYPNDTTGASVGHPTSKICQAACASPYFADYVAGLCVTACITNNTYTDVDSSRTCVLSCNPSGSTPWADNNTWTCVSGNFGIIKTVIIREWPLLSPITPPGSASTTALQATTLTEPPPPTLSVGLCASLAHMEETLVSQVPSAALLTLALVSTVVQLSLPGSVMTLVASIFV